VTRTLTAAGAALALALILPTAGQAAVVDVQDGVLRYTADPGELNIVAITRDAAGDYVPSEVGDRATLRAGQGCREASPGVVCDDAGVQSISISLGDERDHIWVPQGSPVVASGGAGPDSAGYMTGPVRADNDGVADDGPQGQDNILPDVERLLGSAEADLLGGGPAGSELLLGGGDDLVIGGSGPDLIASASVEDVGLDSGTFSADGRDTVRCGAGQDLVLGDRKDVIAADCEATALPARSGSYNYVFSGSAGPDRLHGSYAWGTANMLGRAGNDDIQVPASTFAGPSRVDAGAGNDRVTLDFALVNSYGNPVTVYGGTGKDVIDVRQRKPKRFIRDTVRCGRNTDRVLADKYDVVSRDCEHVTRGPAPKP
jgi:hypothetical protein